MHYSKENCYCYCYCSVASVMSDSVRPHRRQPTRLPRPWDSPGKNTGVGCHFLLQCIKVKVKSLSRVQLLATPWTAAHQDPPSMGFCRPEYWGGVPLPSLLKNTELYTQDLHDQDNHDGVITHLEPDILECEVTWALESITTNKVGEVMESQLSYFNS